MAGSKFYPDSFKKISYCGSSLIIFTGGTYEKPYQVKPTKTKHTIDNCNNCNENYQNILEQFTAQEKKFPNCCEYHSKLLQVEDFYVGDYKDVGKWSAEKIMYSFHHILEWLDKDDWYNEITDYIEYCIRSYGSVPLSCGEPFLLSNYFKCILLLIEDKESSFKTSLVSDSELNQRLYKIKSYLSSYCEDVNEKNKSLSILLNEYNKWFDLFPFELEYFSHLKKDFSSKYPIYNGFGRYNKYMNAIKKESHTVESLSVLLLNITNKVLSSINILSLYEEGKISDIEKTQLNLIIQKRKLDLKIMSLTPNENRKDFIRTLKKWFKDEKKFITEIKPFIEKQSITKKSNTGRPNRTDIAYYVHYLKETKTLELEHPFPSDKAWKDIGQKFNKNAKNIQKAYNDISNKEERLKKTKVKNVEYVIENMLNEKIEALELAKDELKLIKLNS